MDRATLARLEHENMVGAIAIAAGNSPAALIRRERGVALIATGLAIRLFNQVIVTDGDVATPEALADAVAVTRERGDRFVVNLRDGTDDRFVPLVRQLGLVRASDGPWMPGMALHPLPPPDGPARSGAVDGRLEIRRVHDDRGVEDHIITAVTGFELPESIIRAIVTVAMTQRDDTAVYVGYEAGRPVCTGLGVRTGRTIGIYNIATLPDARRQGHGAAMTRRVMDDGRAAGCDTAILQASEMGAPVYDRLGFRTVVEYVAWIDPPG